MIRRIFSHCVLACIYCIACASTQTQTAHSQTWTSAQTGPMHANVAQTNFVQTTTLPTVQAPPLVAVPPLNGNVQLAQATAPAPVVIQQPPGQMAPAFAPPPSGVDMYSQTSPAPLYNGPTLSAPTFGPTFGAPCAAPIGPGCDAACGLPGFIGFIEVFQWETYVDHSPFAVTDDGAGNFAGVSTGFRDDNGYRVGAGWRFCDGWDIVVAYTDFDAGGRRTFGEVPPTGEIAGLPPGLDALALIVGGAFALPDVDSARERVRIDYEVWDVEAGRKYCVCKTLILRPFMGLRFADLRESRRNEYFNFDAGDVDSEQLLTRTAIDGIGPRIGSRVSWNIGGSGFQLYSRGAVSLLWSDVSLRQTHTLDTDNDGVIDMTETYSENDDKIVPVIEIAIGIRYETLGGFFIAGGYEAQNWFDVINNESARFGPVLALPGPDTRDHASDIGFGGWFVRGGYNF